ncbi:cytosine permease [Thioclava sp. FTW29]|uniref:Cytosine permease n=1 Tax=Thioclava litoralis TaxID=3076557 RepID=A0ABZ1E4E0_9RHOB|nr:cytosine permease [Thioclava sp. FTW29]
MTSASSLPSRSALPDAHHGAMRDCLPVLAEDRSWGLLDFVWVQSGLAIATWAFLFGGVTALFVGFYDGLWTMLVGNILGAVVMMMASAIMTCKWGTEHFVMQRAIYGAIGVLVLAIGLIAPFILGWTTILALMFGRASTQVISYIGGTDLSGNTTVITGFAFAALAFAWLIVAKGDKAVRLLNRFVAPGLIVMSAILFAMIFTQHSWAEIVAAAPIDPAASHATNLMLAIELNIAAGAGWWCAVGNIARGARTQRSATWGSFIGLVPVAVLAQMVGLTAALVMGDSDPTVWMLPIVGPAVGAVLLAFLAFANLTSMSSFVFSGAQTFTQHLGSWTQRIGWTALTGAMFAICALLILFTASELYDRFFVFVAWTQAVLISAIGIVIADYYILRRQWVDLEALYTTGPQGRYHFWAGINPAPLVALAAGIATYAALFDPYALVGNAVFTAFSASIPAFMAAFLCHLLLSVLWVIPAGKGGYRSISDRKGPRHD